MKCDPDALETVLGDGNCYFSTLSFILTGSKDNHAKVRALLVENMLAGFHSGVLGAPRGAYLIPWIIIRRMI